MLFLVVVVLLVVGLGVGLYLRSYFSTGRPGTVVSVTVPQGASLTRISQILEDAGVVKHAGAFAIRAQTDGYGSDFKSGVYRLRMNEPYDTLVAALRHGPPPLVVTIPEGYTARQTAALLAQKIPGFSAPRYVNLTLIHPLPFRCPGFTAVGRSRVSCSRRPTTCLRRYRRGASSSSSSPPSGRPWLASIWPTPRPRTSPSTTS